MTMPDLEIPNLTESQKLFKGMVEHLMTVSTGLNGVQEDVRELNKVVLLGNGELPLRETVRNHETFIKDMRYWIRFVGAAIIGQTIIFAFATAIAIVKFLPLLEQMSKKP
jgi:hypothetical protein